MNRSIRHSHPCQSCGVKTPCTGDLYANYDGEPEIACEEFHVGVGPNPNPDFICEKCEWAKEDRAIADRMENV
jgi:hypothetical protein